MDFLHSMLLHYYHYHHKCHTYVLQRESEVSKLRKDLEECNIQVTRCNMKEKEKKKYNIYEKCECINHVQHDATLVSLKKKQADSISEMSEQMDQLNKMKAKYLS